MLLDGLILGIPILVINAIIEADWGKTTSAAALEFVLIIAINGVYSQRHRVRPDDRQQSRRHRGA